MAGNPALALVLALFMLGYILWTTDRLASLSRARGRRAQEAGPRPRPPPPHRQPSAGSARPRLGAPRAGPAGSPSLAPRLAAGYKIAMSIAMGYMLVTML